ncbi:MAG: type II toxin-antitoxin system RelE/ParE family toxin [Treponema sp.]|nr:type II toxin-antitoxin system RelE/ParE family toxin [Candidatus Treponema caballi]
MGEKTYKVNFLDSACKDLQAIKDYWEIVLEQSPDAFMAELYSRAKSLDRFPFSHHQPQDVHLKAKGYRICPVRNYYLFYIVEGDTVQIHRILYNKMDFTKLF